MWFSCGVIRIKIGWNLVRLNKIRFGYLLIITYLCFQFVAFKKNICLLNVVIDDVLVGRNYYKQKFILNINFEFFLIVNVYGQ